MVGVRVTENRPGSAGVHRQQSISHAMLATPMCCARSSPASQRRPAPFRNRRQLRVWAVVPVQARRVCGVVRTTPNTVFAILPSTPEAPRGLARILTGKLVACQSCKSAWFILPQRPGRFCSGLVSAWDHQEQSGGGGHQATQCAPERGMPAAAGSGSLA